ncbi:MAG TPA: DUF2169 domain-containing protein [Polyangiaceae bacterium]|nr:DUF2169 domain-containing protein [Polyangiaceae bacterium]
MSARVSVVELSPLKAAWLLWRPDRSAPVLTVICKATFGLAPGVAVLSSAQDDVNQRDLHTENNPRLGLYSASDMVPYKPRADVTVVGKAFAAPGELARSVIARVKVGSVDKRVEVHAERYLNRHGQLRANAFFSKMPIGYERAPGGLDTPNPVGMTLDGPSDEKGRIALPNLQIPGEAINGRGSKLTPVGLGPIPASWPWRRNLQRSEAPWNGSHWLEPPLPSDWNYGFFNVAPPDQQLEEIRADEAMRLEHLHPNEAQLDTRLPGIRPIVFVERARGAQALAMRADTLWIDTNRLVQTVTWRGQVSLEQPNEKLRVLVAATEAGGAEPSWDQVWLLADKKKRSVEPPPSSDQSHVKTRVDSGKGRVRQPSSQRLTSPVPLVPSNDHSPDWLPPPSMRGVQQRTTVELPMTAEELTMLEQLAAEQALSPADVVRHLVRQAHARRGKS